MRTTSFALLLIFSLSVRAETITVAVASNFAGPMADLVEQFEQKTGHQVRSSAASTGMLFAAVTNGAKYSALLAADEQRPRLLEERGLGVAGSRFTFAIGRLELWSADPGLAGADCRAQLEDLGPRRLAIANPVTAPYGAAAKSFLQAAGLWEGVESRLVYGQNIAQTLQFVVTRNASLGLIAVAQADSGRLPEAACRWRVPASMHEPIIQQAILLHPAADNDVAVAFLEFLRSGDGKGIIRSHGYEVPD